MIKQLDIKIPIEAESSLASPLQLASKNLRVKELSRIKSCKLVKRSLDARKHEIKVNLRYEAYIDEEAVTAPLAFNLKDV